MTRETGKSIDQEHAEPHGKSTANEARPAPPRESVGTRPALRPPQAVKRGPYLRAVWLDVI